MKICYAAYDYNIYYIANNIFSYKKNKIKLNSTYVCTHKFKKTLNLFIIIL